MTTPIDNPEEPGAKKRTSIRVLGVGGAGCQLLQEMVGEGLGGASLVAINTDAKALADCALPEKWLLGSGTIRGLGCGGDLDLGRAAAKEDVEKLKLLCADTDLVFIIAGLGGGTGTGAAPVIAEAAHDSGALVVAVVTLPFDFEGSRRQRQAQLGLRDLKTAADVVLCLPNQKIFKFIDGKATFLDTFKMTHTLVAAGVRGISRMLTQQGLMNVDFADLAATTRGRHCESRFVVAEACGDDRIETVTNALLRHPLFEEDRLAEAEAVLVTIVGGPDLGLVEVDQLMQPVNQQCHKARILIGAIIDPAFTGKLSVTLIASCAATPETDAAVNRLTSLVPPEADTEFERAPVPRPASRFIAPPPEISEEKKQQIVTKHSRGSRRKKAATLQGQLPLEIISRGRFERSEPTIYQGEDLDVPTYIRRGLLLN